MILKFLQPFHGVNNIPKIIFFYVSFFNLDIPIRNNNERYWEYWFNLPAWKQVIFLYLAGRKKEFQQLLYVDYFLSLLKRIFMGMGNGLVKNY